MTKRLKKTEIKTKRLKLDSSSLSIRKNKILFSFHYVQPGKYCFSKLNTDDKVHITESIFKRKNFVFQDLIDNHKYGLGSEKIPTKAINAVIPDFIQDNFLLALRFNGKKPMVGYLQDNIFYILWFDHDFTLYKH